MNDAEYKRLTRVVFDRDGWKCRVCRSRDGLHAHHIQFRSQNGPDTRQNLATVCVRCHDAIHARRLFILSTNADEPLKLEFQGYIPGVR